MQLIKLVVKSWLVLVWCLLIMASCKTYKPVAAFEKSTSQSTDYSQLNNWAAHPAKLDPSDLMPEGDTMDYIGLMADVFFIHPTTYTGDDKGQDQWNASIDDDFLNQKTDKGTILFQASAFNHGGRLFSPRYRQAHLDAYFTDDKKSAALAFDLAYQDVKTAFEYFLKYENKGRPIIIASHSQGTTHAIRLLKEYFSNKPLKNKLVAAYLIGMPVTKSEFGDIPLCQDSTDTGCFVTWRTFKSGTLYPSDNSIAVTNPLKWCTSDLYAPKSANLGTLLFDFYKIYPHHIDAQINGDILWANKPKFHGSIFLRTKNYHIADINFYYFNIRENTKLRVKRFIAGHH